jgi:predicted AlkP superfamily phosphohydrolase/phosphomutase
MRDTERQLRDGIRNIYQAIDRQIERLLQAKSDANFYVISNTGIQDQTPTSGLLRSFCETLGYQVRNRQTPGSFKLRGVLKKLIPETLQAYTLYKVSLPVRQRILSQLYPIHSDWSRTRAFSLSSSYTGMIRVNLKGREPQGIVEPSADYQGLLDQMERDFLQLIDPVTGEPAVEKVFQTAKSFGSGPHDVLPDLFVKWKPAAHFQEILHHPRGPIHQRKPQFYRANNHTSYGFYAACGPSIEKEPHPADRVLTDFAATFLSNLESDGLTHHEKK